MHASLISTVFASVLTLAAAQSSAPAEVVKNNPVGVTYTAVLPDKAFSYPGPQGNVKGSISASANPDGVGVTFKVDFSNLPTTGGPFLYHIHVAPVPEDGNCTKTTAHLDPYARGEVPVCDASHPETCQVGDLSGKHGSLTEDPFVKTYSDNFASTVKGLGSFFGNRSIVVHFANKTRITCANFVVSTPPASNGTSNGTAPSPTPTPYVPASGATGNMAASMLYILSLVGFATFLI